jgi:integrase
LPRVAKWAYLLDDDPDFRRWYENLSRGSDVTAKENARVLFRFLKRHDLSPQRLVEMAREDRRSVENILSDFVAVLHGEGKAPGYIANHLKAVKSWLEFNEVRLVRRIKVGNRDVKTTIMDERVPTKDELRTILLYGSERVRCSISLMAYSGLRPRVLGNSSGTDGLVIRDLPEVSISGNQVNFKRRPTMIVIRPQLSKAGHRYFTFLSAEGCEYLKAYLEKRIALDEDLQPTSPVIAVKRGYEFKGKSPTNYGFRFITTKNVTREIRDTMRPKFNWRPYVLRAYFDTQLMVAENHGRISHSYRQFFMGHKGDMEAAYTTHKGRLPSEVIEDMRMSYVKCEEYLSSRQGEQRDPELTTIKTMVESGVLDLSKPHVRTYLVQKLGLEDIEVRVARMRETGLEENEAAAQVIIGELDLDPVKLEAFRPRKVRNTKKIVREDQLEKYLREGWDIYSALPSGTIVVRKITYD